MRIESLELNSTPESRQELEELADELREEGVEVTVASPAESRKARLEESLDSTTVDIMNFVLDESTEAAVELALIAIGSRLVAWARRRRHFGQNEDEEVTQVGVIWGPDGDVLKTVTLPEPDESES